jgi:hypothetical protein
MIFGMANWSEEGLRRLGDAVAARRDELGLTQLDVFHAGGPANSTLTGIENATMPTLTYSTLRKLDKGLRWPPETALGYLAGKRLDQPSISGALDTRLENVPTAALAAIVSVFVTELRKRADGPESWPPEFLEGGDTP